MVISRALNTVRVDFAPIHRQPSALRVVAATIAATAGSLVADALLVVIGERVFPSTRGYVHFQFGDYAKLTIIGVVIAGLAWPIVTRASSAPLWLYSRLAVLVTIVLLLPDVWLLHQHQSARAVAVLMVMHVAIALVTYLAVTRIAPPVDSRSDQTSNGR
jgi:Family of unknown function (DUF6069)